MSRDRVASETAAQPVLQVQDLAIEVRGKQLQYAIVDGVSFEVGRGKTVCIVGESGSGKTLTALSLMSLLRPPLTIARGDILLEGHSLLSMPEKRRQRLLGDRIAMVFQDPMSSLNPVMRVGEQIMESLARHQPDLRRDERRVRAQELLTLVGVPSPRERLGVYPHEMSGGMRQRVLIAMALANHPQLIVADEPTTALDVTVQAQVMDVMRSACERTGAALLLITHDMGLVAESADEVLVMYAGRIVESGPVLALFAEPHHPYTKALLASIPNLHTPAGTELDAISGEPPNLMAKPCGCAFRPRCKLSRGREICATERPAPRSFGAGRASACHFAHEMAALPDVSEAVQ